MASPDPIEPSKPDGESAPVEGVPVAQPAPPLDGTKPVAEGKEAVERFLVDTDTEGG